MMTIENRFVFLVTVTALLIGLTIQHGCHPALAAIPTDFPSCPGGRWLAPLPPDGPAGDGYVAGVAVGALPMKCLPVNTNLTDPVVITGNSKPGVYSVTEGVRIFNIYNAYQQLGQYEEITAVYLSEFFTNVTNTDGFDVIGEWDATAQSGISCSNWSIAMPAAPAFIYPVKDYVAGTRYYIPLAGDVDDFEKYEYGRRPFRTSLTRKLPTGENSVMVGALTDPPSGKESLLYFCVSSPYPPATPTPGTGGNVQVFHAPASLTIGADGTITIRTE